MQQVGSAPGSVRRGPVRTIGLVVGELLVTVGVVLLLFVAWDLWWTNISTNQSEQQAIKSFSRNLKVPVVPSIVPPASYGSPVVSAAPASDGTVFGVVYIPRFGADYARPLVQGTSVPVLDTLGLGHYDSTSMPGAVGNFVVAGHRQTHGAVLDNIDKLIPGDKIYVQTVAGYYTYEFRNSEIVLPNRTDVLLPVPTHKGAVPVQRIMTLTTCNPRFGDKERFIAYSYLTSWQPADAGAPAAIAAQVAANGEGH